MGEQWIARTAEELPERLKFFGEHLIRQDVWPIAWKAEPYKPPRSLDQNSLLQVWARDFARHVLDRNKITAEEQEAMRITLQRHCYAATGWPFLIEEQIDLFTGEAKVGRRSTTKFKKGEMFDFMSWIQAAAADRGLILESQGEYAELQGRQAA